MELRQIRDFVTVARMGSFAAAARRLNVSQPGLGYQVKQLELELGAPLLVRHSRGVDLSDAGAIFLADAERILAMATEAKQKISRRVIAQRPQIRIGLSPTPQHLLGPALVGLRVSGEAMGVAFREGLSTNLINDVREGMLDVAICIVAVPVRDLRAISLYCEYLHLIAPPGVLPPGDVQFSDLANHRLTVGPRDHVPRQYLDREAARAGIRLNIAQELEPGNLRRALVLHGSESTVASCGMFIDDIEDQTLVAHRIVNPVVRMEVAMVCGPGLSPATEEALVEIARKTVEAHPGAVVEWAAAPTTA
ncbi:LysR family transcriptional regulator [Sphingomonas sp.]|uniref:LysR family transcriptional regulator n=1 Tax=Sphingomonas sp. TaxID=28214 RepID=UPI000DB1B80B|nr:LysR family transcriptional regulator [Sphingomonas sp.]PZU10953.1 MAG: hypothetical protein DI605_04930 [Sphingomonas sp.]